MKILRYIIFFILIICLAICCQNNNVKSISTDTSIIDKELEFALKLASKKDTSLNVRMNYVKKAEKLTEKTNYKVNKKILSLKSYLFGKLGIKDSALFYGLEYLDLVKAKNDSVSIGLGHKKVGWYYWKLQKVDEAFTHYSEAKIIHSELNDSLAVGKNCLNMAILLWDMGDILGTDEVGVEGLKYLENLDYKPDYKDYKSLMNTMASLENCLGTSALKQLDYEDAIKYFDKAILNTASREHRLTYINNKGNVYLDKKDYDTAIKYYSRVIKAFEIDSTITNIKLKAKAIGNYGFTSWKKTSEIIFLKDIERALKIKDSLEDIPGMIISYGHLSEVYEELNVSTLR